MLRFDLRTQIALTVFILLMAAMLLIDFVFVVTLQRELVEKEILRGRAALASMRMASGPDRSGMAPDLTPVRSAARGAAAVWVGVDDRAVVSGLLADVGPRLLQMAREARDTDRFTHSFYGQTWGVFWPNHRFALVAVPDVHAGAGAAMAILLDPVYQSLRNTQKVLFAYLTINGVLLTLLGTFRLSQLSIKPIDRLLKRAETYQDDGSVLFSSERGNSEFHRLSRALNRMMQRISQDREMLRETVRSLERSNLDLVKAQNDIIQAEKLASVGRLSSGIAHEIGNPIGIVLGYLELLGQSGISESEKKEYIHRAQDEINRISTILRQLLDFSRSSTDDARDVSVHEILTDIVEIVKVQPLMAHIQVLLELAAERDCVHADPNHLRQIFLNLVINAADAVSLLPQAESGKLIIASENPGIDEAEGSTEAAMMKLQFIDNGPGIAEKDLGNIFDPFFTTKAPGKGTGLGLSVCFMIIEKIGGRIFAESRDRKGAVITIYLPLASGDHS